MGQALQAHEAAHVGPASAAAERQLPDPDRITRERQPSLDLLVAHVQGGDGRGRRVDL